MEENINERIDSIFDKIREIVTIQAVLESKITRIENLEKKVNELERLKERGIGFKWAGTFAAGIITFIIFVGGALFEWAKNKPSPVQNQQIDKLEKDIKFLIDEYPK